jgi:hypothetical protein
MGTEDDGGTGDPAALVDDEIELPDGSRVVIYGRRSDPELYPSGYKYRFQYLGPDDTTILRYDNGDTPFAEGERHDRHHADKHEEIEFAGDVRSHLDRFQQEVTRIYNERN